jgi:hypothetical protein
MQSICLAAPRSEEDARVSGPASAVSTRAIFAMKFAGKSKKGECP